MADTSGVQELIDKLKNQGVNQGALQAEKIVKEAQEESARLISLAKEETDKLFAEAKKKIELERASAHAAIKIAFRDAELTLRSEFKKAFSIYLKRLVSVELKDKEFLKQLVLAVAGLSAKEAADAKQVEVALPSDIFEGEKSEGETREGEASGDGKKRLQSLVLGITSEMLREGVQLCASKEVQGGISVRLLGEDLTIELTDEAISSLLLKYLLPRYREIISE